MKKNKIYWQRLNSIFLALLVCACGGLGRQSLMNEDIRLEHHEFQFRDKGVAKYFRLEKSLFKFADASMQEPIMVFVVPGSGCSSMQAFLPGYFRGLEGESGALQIYILQKRYTTSTARKNFQTGRLIDDEPCSTEFILHDHPSRWLADQEEFIRHMLARQGASQTRVRRLAIMGISEGAEVAPLLARKILEVTHLVLLGNGGMQPLEAFRLLAHKQRDQHPVETGQASMLDELDQLEKIDVHAPDHSMVNGRTVLYWQELSQLKHSENLLALTIPIFMAMGEADQAVPPESALWINNKFLMANKKNLHLVLFPLADHGLYSPNRFYLPDFMHQVDLWLK